MLWYILFAHVICVNMLSPNYKHYMPARWYMRHFVTKCLSIIYLRQMTSVTTRSFSKTLSYVQQCCYSCIQSPSKIPHNVMDRIYVSDSVTFIFNTNQEKNNIRGAILCYLRVRSISELLCAAPPLYLFTNKPVIGSGSRWMQAQTNIFIRISFPNIDMWYSIKYTIKKVLPRNCEWSPPKQHRAGS